MQISILQTILLRVVTLAPVIMSYELLGNSLLVNFTASLDEGCPIVSSPFRLIGEEDCLYMNEYFITAYAASVASGECEDPLKTPELRLFSEPGAETGLIESLPLTTEVQCVDAGVTVSTVSVVCVSGIEMDGE
ncbi:hypothetical protein BJX62DRAFT_243116 [Aspergillus germanicus]